MFEYRRSSVMTREEMNEKVEQMAKERNRIDLEILQQYRLKDEAGFEKAIKNPMTQEEMNQRLKQMMVGHERVGSEELLLRYSLSNEIALANNKFIKLENSKGVKSDSKASQGYGIGGCSIS